MGGILKAVIVDDEVLARKRILNLLESIQEIEVMHECRSGSEAIKKINFSRPDIVFLDIQLKDLNGFEVLQNIVEKPIIIFITAFDDFALQAFDFFAFDYLLKPFKDVRFYASVEKAIDTVKSKRQNDFKTKLDHLSEYLINPNIANQQFNLQRLSIKTGNRVSFVDKSAIKYITASGYYAEIFTEQKKYLIRESLTNLIKKLNPQKFIRIHRSTIINMSFMTELKHSGYSEIDVKMTDEKLFRVSKSYKKDFQKKIGIG